MSLSKGMVAIVGGAVLLGILINIIVTFYLSYTKLDAVLRLMKNASGNRWHMPLSLGPKGRLFLMAELSALVVFQNHSVKWGRMTNAELAAIPASFKRQLVLLSWSNTALCIALLIVWAVIESG